MGESHENLIKAVRHYQESLDKYTENRNDAKLLHYLEKLYKLPIKVIHLEQTGVGRTVNGLRKLGGEVGDSAKSVVAKWKAMVVGEQEEEDDDEDDEDDEEEDGYQSGDDAEQSYDSETEEKEEKIKRDTSSSHRKSDSNRTDEKDLVKINKHSSKSENNGDSSKNSKKDKNKYHRHNGHSSSNSKHKSHHKRKDDSSSEEDNYKHHQKQQKTNSSDEEPPKYMDNNKYKKRKIDSDSEEDSKPKEKKHKSEDERRKHHKSEHKSRKSRDSSSEHEDSHRSIKSKEKHKESSSSDKKDKHKDVIKDKSLKKEESKRHEHKKAKEEKKDKKSSSKSKDVHKDSRSRERSDDKKKTSKTKSSSTLSNNGIDSGSGASFAEALGMCEPSSSTSSSKISTKKKSSHSEKKEKPVTKSEDSVPKLLKEPNLEPIDLNISSLLPTITPNYRPIGSLISSEPQPKKILSDYEALSNIITSKNQRTKVYSGNKMGNGKVPSLFEMCIRILQDNIDALEYTGGVPYQVLKPILEKATPNQLFLMEHHNPYLIEDTDELWQLHCQKDFRNKKREELESWREMYMRCLDEREAKLKALTANIKQAQDKSLPVRTTKLAYVDAVAKPPRNIARKQAKNGTAFERKPSVTPSARLSSIATSGEAGKVSVPNPGARAVERSSTQVVKPKKAPLMVKSISLLKNRFRR